MASKAAESANICPVCFETRPLKIAGRCKHSFCTECLMTALESADGDVFCCPTCQADCPRPWDGVEGLVNFTGEEVAVEELGILVEQGRIVDEGNEVVKTVFPRDVTGGKETQCKDLQTLLDVKCRSCHHKKKEVQAVNLCVECNNLHICQDCTEVHARNKATHGHVVICFRSERKKEEAVCEMHDSLINRYCHECKQAVCVMCVLFEHGDHTIEKLEDLVDTIGKSLKVIQKDSEEQLKKLQKLEKELTFLTRITPVVDKQDVLIKEIEDHAQKCIEKIIKWKEDLKGQVKTDYQIICDIPECLKKVSQIIQNMQGPMQRAGGLLAVPEYQPVYLDRLMALQQDFEIIAEAGVDVEGEGYVDQVLELHDYDSSFMPVEIESFGKIDKVKATKGDFKPKEIFKFTMPVDSKDNFIPCVANLGQKFAVAHPTQEGEPSNAIDIYKFPGKHQQTFKDHVPPLYDMSATPDGKLTVLSDGTEGTSRCVKLFDSETGYISSTRDFHIAKPLSLGVTLRHQYVILGDNEQGERQITVVDKDGRVEHTHMIKEEIKKKRIKPSRITCGGRFIFVIGKLGCFAYEIKDTGIQGIGSSCRFLKPSDMHGFDISANVWDDFFTTLIFENKFGAEKWENHKRLKTNWINTGFAVLLKGVVGADRETSVSKRGAHIVMSHGLTVKTYKG